MKIVYFSWVRERVGRPGEEVELPEGVATVQDLIGWLSARGEGYADAFANRGVVRAALDRRHVPPDSPLAGAREVAFFPPMTGG
ncbi:MAG: molybdopterin converting factor subunit 1 [Methylobacteriaceae bacterium]|nr:molybdopterin converting factor subunit 1 [Methylobacteriaceae bacterium]